MKKINSISTKCVMALFALMGFTLSAQNIQHLDVNNINVGIGIGGNLFSRSDTFSGYNSTDFFEIPKGSGKDLIFTQALWMSGRDSFGNLHGAGQQYSDFGRDYFSGPIAAVYDTAYDKYYNRVFKVSQAQINTFRNLSFPVNASAVDSSVLYWPGKGNTSVFNDFGVNIASPLAPFVDLNNNGIYEPLLGEYPGICGDEAIFFVFNDARAAHTQTSCSILGVEIRGLANEFNNNTGNQLYEKRAVNNAVFVQYEIENKSQNNYTDFNLGNWLDNDLGCFNNDLVGCDTARNLMFGYNGTATDPDCAPENGYGNLPIALGIKLLNDSLSAFGYFSGQGAPSPAQSDPITCGEYNYYLHGQWADGTNFEVGGNGYNTNGHITTYLFPGDPNDTLGWSEITAHNVPGDRRMYGATHANTFNAGEVKHSDWAFFGSYDSTSDHISIVDTLKRDADILQGYYLYVILPCQQQFATAINEIALQLQVSVYPNPANNQVTIATADNIKTLELLDMQGRVLHVQTVNAKSVSLPVSDLAKGVYLVNIQCNSGSVVRRIVVE